MAHGLEGAGGGEEFGGVERGHGARAYGNGAQMMSDQSLPGFDPGQRGSPEAGPDEI